MLRPTVLRHFFSPLPSFRLDATTSSTLDVTFLPTSLGRHQCYVVLTDDKVGEVIYFIKGTATLPAPEALPQFKSTMTLEAPESVPNESEAARLSSRITRAQMLGEWLLSLESFVEDIRSFHIVALFGCE